MHVCYSHAGDENLVSVSGKGKTATIDSAKGNQVVCFRSMQAIGGSANEFSVKILKMKPYSEMTMGFVHESAMVGGAVDAAEASFTFLPSDGM